MSGRSVDRKIAAEVPGTNFLGEVAVGSADDTDVDGNFLVSANREEGLALEDSKEFCLKGRGISPISSRKSVPPLAAKNLPGFAELAPVKLPCMAEEVSFEEVGRDRRGIHRDERTAAPWTLAVKDPSDEPLPVPLSPVTSVECGLDAARPMALNTRCMASLWP